MASVIETYLREAHGHIKALELLVSVLERGAEDETHERRVRPGTPALLHAFLMHAPRARGTAARWWSRVTLWYASRRTLPRITGSGARVRAHHTLQLCNDCVREGTDARRLLKLAKDETQALLDHAKQDQYDDVSETRAACLLQCWHALTVLAAARGQERKREKKRLRKAYRKFQELDRFASERQALVSADVIVRTCVVVWWWCGGATSCDTVVAWRRVRSRRQEEDVGQRGVSERSLGADGGHHQGTAEWFTHCE